MNELQKRSFVCEVRAEYEDERYQITGRPIVFESITDCGYCYELIKRGALDNADLTDVRFLVNHDFSRIPLARSRRNNGNSTMRLEREENGLDISVLLDVDNNSEARALYSAVERGDISGMSFCFIIDEEKWIDLESEKPTREITRIAKVIEVSAVTFPAYEDTEIYARNRQSLENERRALEKAKESKKNETIELEKLKLKLKN